MEQQLIAVLQQVQSGKITDRNFPNFKRDVFPVLIDVREIRTLGRYLKSVDFTKITQHFSSKRCWLFFSYLLKLAQFKGTNLHLPAQSEWSAWTNLHLPPHSEWSAWWLSLLADRNSTNTLSLSNLEALAIHKSEGMTKSNK